MHKYDTIIIGSGIAGMTAAIYLKRENIDVLLIEKEMPGGQMVKSPLIENYPGFIGIEGAELALQIYGQVQTLNIPLVFETVISIEDGEYKKVKTQTQEYLAKTLILATGRNPRKLNLENEEKLIGKGISYCATCDGAFYKNKEVAVVGGGSSAITEAIFLANLCKKVYVLYRNENLRGEAILKDRLADNEKIEVLTETTISKLNKKDGKLESLSLHDGKTLKINGLFVFIGYEPNTSFLEKLKLKTEDGYIVTDEKMKTNKEGIYACGDAILKDVYQLTTAASEGTIAAIEIKKEILQGR